MSVLIDSSPTSTDTDFGGHPGQQAVTAGLPFLAAGIGIGCVEIAEHAAVAALAPTDLRGSAFGTLATIQALGNLAASAVAGALYRVAASRQSSSGLDDRDSE